MASYRPLGFIGAGNMAQALIRGLRRTDAVGGDEIWASDRDSSRLHEIASDCGIHTTADNSEVARRASVVVLAVKPQVVAAVAREIQADLRSGTLVISIAAGVPTDSLEAHFDAAVRVVRAMPNTPALVGAGATALAAGSRATEDDLQEAQRLFGALGITETMSEELLDAATGISGCGPAFVFAMIEAMADAGVKMGLPRATAQRLAAQTFRGAAELVQKSGKHPGELKDMVTSPGGATIAGMHRLESGAVRATLVDAVEAAVLRARELQSG